MSIVAILTKIFGGSAKEIVASTGKVLDDLITNKEELAQAKLALETEINRHVEALEDKIIKEKALDVEDRSSARLREEAFVKVTGHADRFQHIIGGAAVLCMIGIVVFILNKEIPTKNEHVVMLVIGEILGITTGIYAYHFGSSQGSRIKDMRRP